MSFTLSNQYWISKLVYILYSLCRYNIVLAKLYVCNVYNWVMYRQFHKSYSILIIIIIHKNEARISFRLVFYRKYKNLTWRRLVYISTYIYIFMRVEYSILYLYTWELRIKCTIFIHTILLVKIWLTGEKCFNTQNAHWVYILKLFTV